MKNYNFVVTDEFEKEFKKLDHSIQKIILKWIKKHILETENPTSFGKPLVANLKGYWRYRIGDYRLVVDIQEENFIIVGLHIGHRKEIYSHKKRKDF